MDVVDAIWALGAVITVALTVVGWLVARNHTLNQLVDTKDETIDTLRRQLDRMEITAELTDKFLSQLPRQPSRQRSSGSTK